MSTFLFWQCTIIATILSITSAQSCPSCDIGCNVTTCFELKANDLIFHCRRVKDESDKAAQVILLHGFPEWSHHWIPLMEYWNNNEIAINAVACDLRGYSPLASPDSIAQYNYDILQTDVWAIANALGFNTFHLIGHDHGAALGWRVAGNKSHEVSGHILSYSALSVPHPDVFSDAIYGESAVQAQVIASNYFNQFALPNSATINDDALSILFGYGGFENAQSFQRALWWYNGSIASYLARPPVIPVKITDDEFVWEVQKAIPLPTGPGSPELNPTGTIPVSTLFVCGSEDTALLCTLPYVNEQESMINGSYNVLNVPCGHDLMTCNGNNTVATTVFVKLTEHIFNNSQHWK